MTGMLHHTAMAYLPPKELAELKRQIALAVKCPSCGYDPVLLMRNGCVEVMAHCKPGCAGDPSCPVCNPRRCVVTGVGFCDFCKVDVPVTELVMHITQRHQAFTGEPVLRWPDGRPAVVDTSLEPVDFMDEAGRQLVAAIPRTRWQLVKTYLRVLFRRD